MQKDLGDPAHNYQSEGPVLVGGAVKQTVDEYLPVIFDIRWRFLYLKDLFIYKCISLHSLSCHSFGEMSSLLFINPSRTIWSFVVSYTHLKLPTVLSWK